MKKQIIILVMLILPSLWEGLGKGSLSAQTWQWASHIGSPDQDGGESIVADKTNNLYVAGSYNGYPLHFQSGVFGLSGYDDFFLVKYDNSGNEVWKKQFGGNNSSSNDDEYIADMCYDSINDFIYITGTFYNSTSFGNGINVAGNGFFLAKFDLNGNCIWAKKASTFYRGCGNGVAVDNAGNVYVTGTNSATYTFGTFSVPKGGFIAKYDASGNVLWAKQKFRYFVPVVPSELEPNGIQIYNSNILIAGSAYNDTIVVDTITALNHGNHSAFISSFDLNGNIKWLKLCAGRNDSNIQAGFGGSGFSSDKYGNSYISGYFTDTGYFDTLVLTNNLKEDAFLAKYDINGKRQWVQQLHSSNGAESHNVSTNANGETYITGYFRGTANFGAYQVVAATGQEMFAARYDSSGVCMGVRHIINLDGVSIYSKDNTSFWIMGQFVGTTTIGTNTFTGYGNTDLFIAKSDALTGITDKSMLNSKNQLSIYANPSKGICNITIPDDFVHEKNLVMKIYSNDGKLVQQVPVEMYQEKVIVNLEAEATGIYNVTMSNGKKTYTGKIVFE
jgi:hypothetical protein